MKFCHFIFTQIESKQQEHSFLDKASNMSSDPPATSIFCFWFVVEKL